MHGLTAFPATVATLSNWIGHKSKHLQPKTMKKYLTGLGSAQIDMGHENLAVFYSPLLQRLIAGSRRLHGEADTKERLPITKDILLKLIAGFDQSTRDGSTLYASFCLAFAAFLRIGEFTYSARDLMDIDFPKWFLTRRSVKLYDDHLELTLPASKTDPFRQGITLTVAATGDEACAIRALHHLFMWPARSSAPLFQLERSTSFTREFVTATLRESLAFHGIHGHYSGHSFRRGAATWAKRVGLSSDDIQLLGRWKSDCYRLYITTHPQHILAASRRHQQLPFYQ